MEQSTVKGFDHPTDIPEDEGQAREWQAANREWWEANSMRYDWQQDISAEEYSSRFFDEIDHRFLTRPGSSFPPPTGTSIRSSPMNGWANGIAWKSAWAVAAMRKF